MNESRLASAAALAFLLTACATPEGGGAPVPAGGPAGCFYARQVSDFRVLDRSTMIVYAPSRATAYQVRVVPPSSDLKFAEAIAFTSRSGRICGYAGDSLRISGARTPYSIASVYRLDAVALDRLLGQYGLGQGTEELEPGATEGADIEADIASADGSDKHNSDNED